MVIAVVYWLCVAIFAVCCIFDSPEFTHYKGKGYHHIERMEMESSFTLTLRRERFWCSHDPNCKDYGVNILPTLNIMANSSMIFITISWLVFYFQLYYYNNKRQQRWIREHSRTI